MLGNLIIHTVTERHLNQPPSPGMLSLCCETSLLMSELLMGELMHLQGDDIHLDPHIIQYRISIVKASWLPNKQTMQARIIGGNMI